MDLRLYSKQLTDIYLVSNTPSYLYETMRKSSIVKDYIGKLGKEELFAEFSQRIKSPITNVSDIAEIYAIMIGLTYKDGEDIRGFFQSIYDHIKFEWFAKIADYYLSNQSTSESFSFQFNPPSKIEDMGQANFKVTSS
jgi:hypothetical protein